MIVFVSAYDEATRANLAVARDLRLPHADRLIADGAVRTALHLALRANGAPLFAMSHGKPDHLCAQHCSHATDHVALSVQDVSVLGSRSVFAYACHTAARLGPEVSSQGVTFWGYIREITAPDARDAFRGYFVRIFDYIGESFPGAGSAEQRRDVLERIKALCDEAALAVDEAADADPTLDVLETYQSLRDLWQYLRVNGAGAASAESHACAPAVLPRPYV